MVLCFTAMGTLLAQNEKLHQGKIDIHVGFGPAYSFFVKYEQSPDQVPPGFIGLYNKKSIGILTNIGIDIKLNPKNRIELAYARQIHVGKKNFKGMANGASINVIDFKLRHTNNFFELNYFRSISSENNISLLGGVYLIYPEQQEIDIFGNAITVDERNYKNAYLVDAGVTLGIRYLKPFSGRFSLGLESKVYYTVSLASFETISLTPILSYNF